MIVPDESRTPGWEWDMAGECLAGMDRRWSHSQRAHAQSHRLGSLFNAAERAEVLVLAALLHDIGYGTELVRTGFHAIDGALFLRDHAVDEQVVSLVAHHSCAGVEADIRGLSAEMSRFPVHPDPLLVDAMIWYDMTSGPAGEEVGIDWRLEDIRRRYTPGSIVARTVEVTEPLLRAGWSRVEDYLARPL